MGERLSLFYEASFYLAGFFICLSSLIYTFIRGKTKRSQNRIYIYFLLCVMAGGISDTGSVYAALFTEDIHTAIIIRDVCLFVYFFSHALLAPLLYVYMIYISGSVYLLRKHKWHFSFLMIPFILMEIMVIINPFTGILYRIDDGLGYIRSPLIIVYYLIAGLYFIMALVDLARRWNVVIPRCRYGLFFLYVLTMLGILIQFVRNEAQVEIFFESIALMCAMILIENDEERLDLASGLLNRNALNIDLNSYISIGQEFSVTMVYINDYDVIEKMTGNFNHESIIDDVAKYLKSLMPYYHIYKMSTHCFVLVGIGQSADETGEQAVAIRKRFDEPYRADDVELKLQALVMYANYPKDISAVDEVFLMTDTPVTQDMYKKTVSDTGLEEIKRSIKVERALRRGFKEHNFEVFYQPVYFLENLNIHSAEALIRLHDGELGDIPPAEFIPIAERDGLIDMIGDFVIDEVCLFLASGLPVEMGIEYISINISILQCMKPGFAKYVKDKVLRYDISPSRISFEIKESAAASEFDLLRSTIKELKAYGFRFLMDSYGTGFSDIRSLYSLDFDVIKIDKSILSRADDGSIGRVVLESCVRMIRQMHRRILVEGVESREQIELLKKLDADYVQGYYSSRPITKNELLGILRVTELARMEERKALAASEAKSSFLANMSHEIRTPINAVLGMNEMILRECDEEDIMRYAKEMETAGRNLLSLINNILDYSKIEAGEMEIVEAEYDLRSALSDVIKEIKKKTDQKHLSFNVNVSDGLPARLYGDEFRLKQIMMNILNNAVKYTSEGGVLLTVEGELYSENEVMLRMIVEDTGCGIREEDQSRLYEMFQRLDMEKNRTVEGFGLGLAISYNLLQMMQGQIDVNSEYGMGSTFTIQLIQKKVGDELMRVFRPREIEELCSDNKTGREFKAPDARLLIIDDTPLNHVVMLELLKESEMSIDTALSGEEGLLKAGETHYDLIFMDELMPGMSGTETLKNLRNSGDAVSRRSPVISMTAGMHPGMREAKRNEGFDAYLEKPVERQKLIELLAGFLPESKVFYV
ncbi:MAG: EAL domain-containing protein [Lachnospiraceae bacterium]|nr:EAL domain-containing protein [Lachnospiraceae bacterium]